MALSLADLQRKTDEHLSGTYETYKPRGVPEPGDIPLGKKAAQLEATALFIDLRQSSDITNSFRRQTAAKMFKSYFDGAVRITNAHSGTVRSFNGDGMLALFVGDFRSSNAAKAAMETVWFVREVLRPKFQRYFANNRSALGQDLSFDIGCGLDDGVIYAVRVGIRGTNDVSWVGRCTNTAAKLSNGTLHPNNIAITREAYNRLHESRKTSTDGRRMWSNEVSGNLGGEVRYYRTSSFGWVIS